MAEDSCDDLLLEEGDTPSNMQFSAKVETLETNMVKLTEAVTI